MTRRRSGVLALLLMRGACGGTAATSTAVDANGDNAAAQDVLSSPACLCNQVVGVSVTGDWFAAGFEQSVDDSRWQAVAEVVAAYPGLVSAAPKFEAPNCDVFLLGGPHFMPDGAPEVAKVYGAHYAKEP